MAKHSVSFFSLALSSMETIFHRSRMIGKAYQGELSFFHPEFTQMANEKFIAMAEGNIAMAQEMMRLYFESFTKFPSFHQPYALYNKLAQAALKPASKAAGNNAKRLRKQAFKAR